MSQGVRTLELVNRAITWVGLLLATGLASEWLIKTVEMLRSLGCPVGVDGATRAQTIITCTEAWISRYQTLIGAALALLAAALAAHPVWRQLQIQREENLVAARDRATARWILAREEAEALGAIMTQLFWLHSLSFEMNDPAIATETRVRAVLDNWQADIRTMQLRMSTINEAYNALRGPTALRRARWNFKVRIEWLVVSMERPLRMAWYHGAPQPPDLPDQFEAIIDSIRSCAEDAGKIHSETIATYSALLSIEQSILYEKVDRIDAVIG